MGGSQTKNNHSTQQHSERVVGGLKNKVKLLQGEINEIMCIRESESQAYERELMVFSFKQAEWRRERKNLKDEIKKLRKVLEDHHRDEGRLVAMRSSCMEGRRDHELEKYCCEKNNGDLSKCCCCCCNDQEELVRIRDETVKKWKQLYFAIKVELDDLIQRTTHHEESLCWKTEEEEILLELKNEVKAKDQRIEFLQARLVSMEHQESKREREIDILRQSLRIMSHKKAAKNLIAKGQL